MFKKIIEIDGQRYPEDSVNNNYAENRDPKFLFREFVGEGLLYPFISFACMKIFYLFQAFDLKHQVDHFTLKKFQLFQEYRVDPNNARIFVILIRHTQPKMVSDGNKVNEVKFI